MKFESTISPSRLIYPPPVGEDFREGLYPIDFILEDILKGGIAWFKNNADAPRQVFGQLEAPWLAKKYGTDKINEIANFINKYDIRVVQHFSLIDQSVPSISILLGQGEEEESRAGLDDFLKEVDTINEVNQQIESRETYGYIPVSDHIQIGIHSINTPDLTKYLYYLVIYLLNVFKMELQERGLLLTTFRATDISRLDDRLPENMYSRYVHFSAFTTAFFVKHKVPTLKDIFLDVELCDSAPSDGG